MNTNTQTTRTATHSNKAARTLRLALALSAVLSLSACVVPVQTVRHDPQPRVNTLKFVKASGGHVPRGALQAGADRKGEALYVCSVRYNGATHLGKVRKGIGGCHIGFGGKEKGFSSYKVGLGYGNWANGKKGAIPYGAVAYGRESGQPLYVCRAMHRKGLKVMWQPGKVGPSTGGTCNFGYGGKEYRAKAYQVLMP